MSTPDNASSNHYVTDEEIVGGRRLLDLPSSVLRKAVSGRSAISASIARCARPIALSSSVVDRLNRVSSTAPSTAAPMTAAAIAATIISRSILSVRSLHSHLKARKPAGTPLAIHQQRACQDDLLGQRAIEKPGANHSERKTGDGGRSENNGNI